MARVDTNLMDRLVLWVNPRAGEERLYARHNAQIMASGAYSGGNRSRMRLQQAHRRSRPLDEDHAAGVTYLDTLRLEAWDLYRNNELAKAGINRISEYSVGQAMVPEARTIDDDFNREADQFWQWYQGNCDARRRVGFHDFLDLNVKARHCSGDYFYAMLKDGTIQPIEAERVKTPQSRNNQENVVNGVLLESGRPLGVYVGKRNKSGRVDGASWQFVKRENLIWGGTPIRFDQVRSVPLMHGVIDKLRDFDETDEYTLNKTKNEQMHLYKTEGQNRGPKQKLLGDSTDEKVRIQQEDWGQVIYDPTMELIESKSPNSMHVQYMEFQARLIATALNIPYEYLMMIFTQGSYTAQRAAKVNFKRTCLCLFRQERDQFAQRLRNWRIAKAIKNGEIRPAPMDENGRSEWWKCSWSLPYFEEIDVGKEVRGYKDSWNSGYKTHSQIATQQGDKSEDLLRGKLADIANAARLADEANKKHNLSVSWRDLLGVSAGEPPKTTEGK